MYGAERQVRSAPDVEIKSEADDRAFSEPSETSKTDVIGIVCALDSGGLIRVIRCGVRLGRELLENLSDLTQQFWNIFGGHTPYEL